MDRDQTEDERHTMENKGQVGAIRGVGERESSRQQGQRDTKSIICFRANKPTTVRLRLSNLEEENRKGCLLHYLSLICFPSHSEVQLKAGC